MNTFIKALPFALAATMSSAQVPAPNFDAAAFFLSGTIMSVPNSYWQGSGNSYTLRMYPNGNTNGTPVNQLPQWNYVFQRKPGGISFSPTWDQYPAFSGSYGRQCVAFSKAITGGSYTGNWYPKESVIPQNKTVSWDQSWKYAGRMIAYFGGPNPNPNVSYLNSAGSDYNHVGTFLKYQYNHNYFPAKITGIWILDANWGGTGNNPIGKIRKHLIPVNGYGKTRASNYYLVDVR